MLLAMAGFEIAASVVLLLFSMAAYGRLSQYLTARRKVQDFLSVVGNMQSLCSDLRYSLDSFLKVKPKGKTTRKQILTFDKIVPLVFLSLRYLVQRKLGARLL